MEFDYYREFITLSETKSFSKAADMLFIAQPVLTRHIQKLEDEIGCPLFIRSNPLKLTKAGEFYYEGIKEIVSKLDNLLINSRLMDTNYNSILKIGLPEYTKLVYLPYIRKFQRSYPQIDLEIYIENIPTLLQSLQNNALDIVTIYDLEATPSRVLKSFVLLPIERVKVMLLVNASDNRFRNRDTISIAELQKCKLIQQDSTFQKEQFRGLQSLASKHGASIESTYTAKEANDALIKVLMNDAVLFQPDNGDIDCFGKQFKMIAIDEPEFTYIKYFAWKYDNTNLSIPLFAKRMRSSFQSKISPGFDTETTPV